MQPNRDMQLYILMHVVVSLIYTGCAQQTALQADPMKQPASSLSDVSTVTEPLQQEEAVVGKLINNYH